MFIVVSSLSFILWY